MAEQNPPGSRPGRPFVPPFRRPTDSAAPASPARPGATPSPSGPRPFVPPGARPAGTTPQPQPRPAVPAAPERAAATPAEPFAPPSPTADDFAVEHAISETLGQGTAPSKSLGLELERASEPSSEALRSTEHDAAPPPELTFLSTTGEAPPAAPRGSSEPSNSTVEAIEDALRVVAAHGREVEASDRPPSDGEPLPWIAAPAEAEPAPEPRVEHEITTPTFLIAGGYDMAEMRRPIVDEASRRTRPSPAPVEPSTIVGANISVAEALESVARRVRGGELRVPAIDSATGEAGALAAVLAVLLGVRS